MKIGKYDWWCPVCGEQGAIIGGAKPDYSVSWLTSTGGSAVCTKCAKNKNEEIYKHNRIYHNEIKNSKDINCEHEWIHPSNNRWVCNKCFAEFNMMCGCGGSGYCCEEHYIKFIKEHPNLKNFLSENSW